MGAGARWGAHGLHLHGLEGASRLLAPAPDEWPSVRIERANGQPVVTGDQSTLATDWAFWVLRGGGSVRLDRAALTARFTFPDAPADEEIVHPFLFAAAATVSRWFGRETFHAGAFAVEGGAYAVLAERGRGKSSTLGWLVQQGYDLITDDLLAVDHGDALGGPACVDLRPDAARLLGVGESLGVVGSRERWRYVTAPPPARTPLRGWIFPQWDDQIELRPLPPAERLARLLAALALPVGPTDGAAILQLASLPAWELRRPPRWEALAPSVDRLLAAVAG